MKNSTTQILAEIEKFDIISFDIFDTLLSRYFIIPKDLFFYVGINALKKYKLKFNPTYFSFQRINSELTARKKSSKEDIELKDIYDELSSRLFIDTDTSDKIMEEELLAEKKFIYRREELYYIYEFCVRNFKKIFFLSDMYLPKFFLEELLKEKGFIVDKNILLSSDLGITKQSKNLFQYYKENIINKFGDVKMLHIGDNFTSDIENCRCVGLNAYYIQNHHDEYLKIPYVEKLFKKHLNSPDKNLSLSLYAALISKKFLDCIHPPFSFNKNSLFNGDPYCLGYSAFGFLLIGFCDWLIKVSKDAHIDTLVFVARDGYIIKEVYDIVANFYENPPKSIYMLASRRSFQIPLLTEKKFFNQIFNSRYNGTLENFITSRLGLEIDSKIREKLTGIDISCSVDTGTDAGYITCMNILLLIENEIKINAQTEKRALKLYLEHLDVVNDNIALVDLGHTGTIPVAFNDITGVKAHSFNLLLKRVSVDFFQTPYDLNAQGWLCENIPFFNNSFSLDKKIPLLETLFSTDQHQLEKHVIQNDGTLKHVFLEYNEPDDIKRIKFITAVHRGALDFAKEFCFIRDKNTDIFYIDKYCASILLEYHFHNPSFYDIQIWNDIYFENNFSGWEKKVIISASEKFTSLWDEAKQIYNENKTLIETLPYSENIIYFFDIIWIYMQIKPKDNDIHSLPKEFDLPFYEMISKYLKNNNLETPYNFDDFIYLRQNLDVFEAVKEKKMQSGYVHYILHGMKEGRKRSTII